MKLKYVLISLMCFFLVSFILAGLTDGLAAYYKMDDDAASTAVDDEIDAYEGTASFNTDDNSVTGKIETALNFVKTSSDYVNIGTHTLGSSGEFSFSLWAKATDPLAWSCLIGHRDDSPLLWRFIGVEADGDVAFYLRTSAEISDITAGTYDGTDMELYIDGSSVGTTPHTPNPGNLLNYIGDYASNANAKWNGPIDEVGVWNRALTSDEVTELWNSGDGWSYPFAAADTCTCAGAGNNWEIDHSDACIINDDCDLTTGTLSFTGVGTTKINATITTTNLGEPGATGILKILSNALIRIKG